MFQLTFQGARRRSGRASDSESRGPGFDSHKRHRVVSLSKTHLLPTVLVKPRKSWLRLDMTEKLLTGTLRLNTNKQINISMTISHFLNKLPLQCGASMAVCSRCQYLSRLVGKPTMWFPNRSDINWPAQLQKQARSLKFWG